MQKYIISFVILFFIILSSSCRKDFDTVVGNSDFRVEKDTLFLDSVFTNIASHTYRVKVYNTANKDITLNSIRLENGNQSFYRLNVDGTNGKSIEDVLIHAKDSIFIFVEVTADINQLTSPVYEEKLIVEDDGKTDDILLVSFVKDALFLYPERFPDGSKDSLTVYTDPNTGETNKIPGYFLPDNTTFTADKPIVIYGNVAVPQGKTLTIEQDAHLYFHFNSSLIVWEDASLQVNGTLGHEVIFEDDRMEPDYEKAPGMWNYIWLRENSKNNVIDYAIIKNATIGVIAHPTDDTNPMLNIKNTKIFNHSLVGIYAVKTIINGENLVLNNFGLSAINIQLGGSYDFKHCTFTNFGGGIRNEKSGAVYVNNYIETQDGTVYVSDLNQFNLSNSIVYGNSSIEFYLDNINETGVAFNYQIHNNLIRFNDPQHRFENIAEVNFADTNHFQNIILNEDPVFEDERENLMRISNQSPAINQGNSAAALLVPLDILGSDRTASPDLGAYQNTVFSN
jgi:hypothetical protein